MILMGTLVFSQKRIVVQNVTSTVFDDINDAIIAANPGDTIYLPGGTFSITVNPINKTLHFIGVGHYPNSVVEGEVTKISSGIVFTGNCDNCSLTGMSIGSLTFGDTNGNETENISISRCNIIGGIDLRRSDIGSPTLNTSITESVFNRLDAHYGVQVYVSKCIIASTYTFLLKISNSIFEHNIFYGSPAAYQTYSDLTNCLFRNNIISNSLIYYSRVSSFVNNIFNMEVAFPYGDNNSGSNNITIPSSSFRSLFEHITNEGFFNYDNDYHLVTGSPAVGAADDGTDLGIYGSPVPYKVDAIPFNPHIRSVNIPLNATHGELPVEITVEAQPR